MELFQQNTILELLHHVEFLISVGSVLIVVYGAVIAGFSFIKIELFRFRHQHNIQRLRVIRADLGSYLLLALEVLIAADIIKTIVEPDLMDLLMLAAIVVIRTVLSIFLNKEIHEIDRERDEHPEHFTVL